VSTAAQSRPSARLILRVLFLLGAAFVTVMSLLPARDLPKVAVSDKLEHAGAYFVLAVLGGLGLRERRGLLFLFIVLCAMGGAIELLQSFSPGRTPDVFDALANATGAAVGTLVSLVVGLRWRR
jgi:VanZ family protein